MQRAAVRETIQLHQVLFNRFLGVGKMMRIGPDVPFGCAHGDGDGDGLVTKLASDERSVAVNPGRQPWK